MGAGTYDISLLNYWPARHRMPQQRALGAGNYTLIYTFLSSLTSAGGTIGSSVHCEW